MDYEKKIYPIDNSIMLNKLLAEREKTPVKEHFHENTGLYVDKIDLEKVG